jgi:hypothetical protein
MCVRRSERSLQWVLLVCLLASGVISVSGAYGQALDKAVKAQLKADQSDAVSQKKIDSLAENTREMLEEYKLALRQTESLHVYNNHLERLIQSQKEELVSINQQLKELEFTNQGIVPLMVRMVDTLKSFVELDLPFLLEERRKRVESLEQNMDRADVSTAEKYRRIMEAYQVEADYGRTIEAYTDMLEKDGESRSVNYLRIGRIAYLYQTLDGERTGIWDPVAGEWRILPDEYRSSVSKGLRTARKQLAPDLLTLPIRAPEIVQ